MTVSTLRNTSRAWVEVNLAALRANARTVQKAAQGAPLLPMVKAEAYGAGLVPVAQALEEVDPWGFGVATVEEGAQLRAAGIRRPILVFTPAVTALRAAYREYDLRSVVDNPDVARAWDRPFHVEIDTGMSRCGVRWDAPAALARFSSPQLEGAFTHFYAADTRPESVAEQWDRFEGALAALGTRPALVHAANSAAAFRLGRRLDLARPGIFLYGGAVGRDLPLPAPVVSVRAPVVSLRQIPPGATVSYGGDWVAQRTTTVATLGIGYADGVPRAVQGRAEVLLGGRRLTVVGRVTMDFMMVDLEGERVQEVGIGDVATVIGTDRAMTITVDEFAGWARTISYEILARLGGRLRREYVDP